MNDHVDVDPRVINLFQTLIRHNIVWHSIKLNNFIVYVVNSTIDSGNYPKMVKLFALSMYLWLYI